jgi:hypothetical protein
MPTESAPKFPRFAVAMFEAEWVEGENDPKAHGPLSTFAYSCSGETHKTLPLDLAQQSQLAADLDDFMREWIQDNCGEEP